MPISSSSLPPKLVNVAPSLAERSSRISLKAEGHGENGRFTVAIRWLGRRVGACFWLCVVGMMFCLFGSTHHEEGCGVGSCFFAILAIASVADIRPGHAAREMDQESDLVRQRIQERECRRRWP